MPMKWLQERHNGSKNDTGIGFEGPDVGVCGSVRGSKSGTARVLGSVWGSESSP